MLLQKSPFAGPLGTRRIPMHRVAGLVLAGLVLLLNVTLTHSQDRCPTDGAEPSVPCDAPLSDCFHRCCFSFSSGVCPAFSCGVSLDSPTDTGTICSGTCLEELVCAPVNPNCPENEPVCIGTVVCLTANCGGRAAGSVCLMAGEVIKVCEVT
jgi:hypothetical protein